MDILLGTSVEQGSNVYLTEKARRQGVYVIGTTGTGKSTFLQNIAYQDMKAGAGLCVIDPHGDMIDGLLERVPHARRDQVIVFAPGDNDQINRPLGLNVFDCNRSDPRETRRVASAIMETLHRIFSYSWGPRMEDLLRSSIYALLERPDTTFLHLWYLLSDVKPSDPHKASYLQELAAELRDPYLKQFWTKQFPKMTKSERDSVELVGSSLNKISRFLIDPLMRRIVSQKKSAFNIKEMMDKGHILLVNLSKGALGEDNSSLLGSVIVNQILSAALQRRDTPAAERRPFHLIVDEYQNFATTSFPVLQSEARKYAIDVIVAHQFRDQLDDLNKGSTMNVANFVMLRTSGRDSHELASQFDNTPPEEDPDTKPIYGKTADGFTVKATTAGTGTDVYQEVSAPRRTFNDVQAERANLLATLHDYEADIRIIKNGRTADGLIKTLDFTQPSDPAIAVYIRQKSLALGQDYRSIDAEVETLVGDSEFSLLTDDPRDEQ